MRGGYGPIGQQLMQARGVRTPGAVFPPPMDDDEMAYPGGGDMGMEMMEDAPTDENIYEPGLNTMPQGQAMPVHSRGEVEKIFQLAPGSQLPRGVEAYTQGMERLAPYRQNIHAGKAYNNKHRLQEGAIRRRLREQAGLEQSNESMDIESMANNEEIEDLKNELQMFRKLRKNKGMQGQ